MGILNRLFGSEESVAKEMKLDDEAIARSWNEYLKTISKQKPIIERLKVGSSFNADLYELKRLQEIELVDIRGEEIKEEELISDLEWMEHSQKIKRVHRLEQCLNYAKTRGEYVYNLLQQIYHLLKTKMHLTDKLLAGSNDPENLIAHLKSQFELEWAVIKKIAKTEGFQEFFSALVKGEHIIKTLDSKEYKLLEKMQKVMYGTAPEKMEESIIYKWSVAVFDAIKDRVLEGTAFLPQDHPYVDFEYVNRPEFVDLVKEKIMELRGRETSDMIINAFVHMFREWYNHERD